MKQIITNKFFLLGLLLKVAIILIITPPIITEHYGPFIENSLNHLTIDPWGHWLQKNGNIVSFPYGYTMWFVFLPLAILSKFLGFNSFHWYGLTLLFIDIGLLILIAKTYDLKKSFVIKTYWLSPIILVAGYWLSFNDLIPIFFLILSLLLLRKNYFIFSGISLIAAISAKVSMAIALPFFIIFVLQNRGRNQPIIRLVYGAGIGTSIFLFPFLGTLSGIRMVLKNPEINKIYQFSFFYSDEIVVFLAPLVYIFLLYGVWRLKRVNFKIFNSTLGLVFLSVILITPAPAGWFMWSIPFLVLFQSHDDKALKIIISLFSIAYVLENFIIPFFVKNIHIANDSSHYSEIILEKLPSLSHTLLVAIGFVLVIKILRELILFNDFFVQTRKPLVIGISGDSGSGKDTLVNSLIGLFGTNSTALLSGDDYHLWDRQQPIWGVMTHVNPMANDLERFGENLVSLVAGKSIQNCHYDHSTGILGRSLKVKSNEIVIASGLHALYLPIYRKCYDLSIYLNLDEDLRKYFKLKRDVIERGYDATNVLEVMLRRKKDSELFIYPQANYADLIFSISPTRRFDPENLNFNKMPPLKLAVTIKHGLNELDIKRILIGICGLHVEITNQGSSTSIFIIEGEVDSQDIKIAAELLMPQVNEFLNKAPRWSSGVLGLMQLFTLSQAFQSLKRRLI